MDVTYSFTDCLGGQQHCDVELFLANYSNNDRSGYGSGGIMPDNLIEYTSSVSSGTKQFFFDSDTSVTGFFLALISREACVNVSRVLVYHYECPGSDRIPPTSLLRRPATPAPASSGQRPVKPYCADNAHLKDETLTIACRSGGIWNDGEARCECNSGYREDEEGTKIISPSNCPVLSSAMDSRQLSPSPKPNVVTGDSEATKDCVCEQPKALLAVVAVLVVLIFALILVVVALVIALATRTNRKLKPNEKECSSGVQNTSGTDRDLSNPVYQPLARNVTPTAR